MNDKCNSSTTSKAMVGRTRKGVAVWAHVSPGKGLNDRVAYRTPGEGHQNNGFVQARDILWSAEALDFGRNVVGWTGQAAAALNRGTVVLFVSWVNTGKSTRSLFAEPMTGNCKMKITALEKSNQSKKICRFSDTSSILRTHGIQNELSVSV